MEDEQLDLDSRLAYTQHLGRMAGTIPLDSPIFNTREAQAYRLGYKMARQGNARDETRWGMASRLESTLFNKGYLAGKV